MYSNIELMMEIYLYQWQGMIQLECYKLLWLKMLESLLFECKFIFLNNYLKEEV